MTVGHDASQIDSVAEASENDRSHSVARAAHVTLGQNVAGGGKSRSLAAKYKFQPSCKLVKEHPRSLLNDELRCMRQKSEPQRMTIQQDNKTGKVRNINY